MHGYQIIQELSARSGGAWSPSAGSVYPTLQLLADEGLVDAEETAGKKVFSLTDAGVAAVAETADQPAPWDEAAQSDTGGGLPRGGRAGSCSAVFQIGKSGSAEQIDRCDRDPHRGAQEALHHPRRGLSSRLPPHTTHVRDPGG